MPQDSPIRQLAFGDAKLVRELLVTFGDAFDDADTYTRAQPSYAYLDGLLRSDQFIALAALQSDAVIATKAGQLPAGGTKRPASR